MTSPAGSTVMALKDLHLEGNIIPMEWFAHLKFDSGKPDMNAILILSDIVYWYRPVVVRDEQTGMVTGYRKKFKSDLLQKSYQHYADLFGLSKRQVSDAIIRLEERGLVKRVLRTIETPSMTLQNILFIALNVQKLAEINVCVGGVTFYRDTPPDRKGDLPRSIGTPPPIERDTYTKITTKTPTETTTHSQGRGEEFLNLMLDAWNDTLHPSIPVQMTSSRSVKLRSALEQHFGGDLAQWRSFCQDITRSPFLMGQGQRKWRVTLDWILEPHNLQKTLEGNYRDLNPSSSLPDSPSAEESTCKAQEDISRLEDPALQQFARVLLKFIPANAYLRWFSDLRMESVSEKKLMLFFPNRANRDYAQQRFSSEIRVAAQAVYPNTEWIDCLINAETPSTPIAIADSPISLPEFQHSASLREEETGEYSGDIHLPSCHSLELSSPDPLPPSFPDGMAMPVPSLQTPGLLLTGKEIP